MATKHEGPFFNLKVVVRQTGLKPDTLRAWERRYGMPSPGRSGGHHRLYSQRDIDIIKWLVARQEEGLSISRAVELWHQVEAEGLDPLLSALPFATQEAAFLASQTPSAPLSRSAADTMAQLREQWLNACLSYAEIQADQVLTQAFALYSPETVCVELILAAVAEIGARWYRGQATVQQEHFVTEQAVRRLEALIIASPPPTRSGRALLACPPEDQHTLSMLLLTYVLRRRGWEAVYLGANVPLERLGSTIAVTRPRLVVMSAQQLQTAATLLDAAHLLQEAGVPLAYGGLIFNRLPSLRERIPGHFLGERIDQAPQGVEALMAAPRPAIAASPISEAYHGVRDHFLKCQALIESDVIRSIGAADLEPDRLAMANREMAQNISAALALGDPELVGTDIEWLAGLLRNLNLSTRILSGYLNAYRQAAQTHLDERGEPIVACLARLAEQA